MLIFIFCIFTTLEFVSTQRLTRDVYPVHYSVKLHPNIDSANFSGQVSIHIKSNIQQDKLILHSRNLNISEIHLNGKFIQNFSFDYNYSELHIFEKISIGASFLQIKFNGSLFNNDLGFGFIKEIYLIEDPKDNITRKHPIIATEFEPDHAREAFPCFDEPYFKSNFNIRLISPNDTFRALSNMNVINKFATPDGIVYDFATTVKMSTYLLAFAITDYKLVEKSINVNGKSILVRFNLHRPLISTFPFELVEKTLNFYANYTNINCVVDKIDFLEYDKTTRSLATENWGLITIQQGVIGEDCFNSSSCQLVMVHELTHYWFGNLVTQDWWNGIWLSEGFTSYFTIKAMRSLDMDTPLLKTYYNLEDFTSIDNVPLSIVSNIDFQLEKAFDQNIYNKGAYILATLEDILGAEMFQNAIRTYLKRFAFKTATIYDFIEIVEEVVANVNPNIRYFLEGYLYQQALPYLFVSKIGNKTYSIHSNNERSWQVPLQYASDLKNVSDIIWFDRDQITLKLEVKMEKWFILRPNNWGLYNVNYSPEVWDEISNSFSELNIENQNAILNSAFYAYAKRLVNCDVFIKFLPKIKGNYGWWRFTRQLKQDLGEDFNREYQLYVNYLINIIKKVDPSVELLRGNPSKERFTDHPTVDKCRKWISENLNKTLE